MTNTVEHTGSGFVVRDATGRTIATVALSTGPEPGCGALLFLAGDLSIEIPLDVDGLKHGEEVFRRHYCAALFAKTAAGEPCVPRCEPEPSRV